MLELIISRENQIKKIALVQNGKLVEYYEDSEDSNRNEGNIYRGVIKDIIRGMQSAFVDIGTEKNSFIHLKDIIPKVDEKKEKIDLNKDIKDVIKVNDTILVQVKKDSNDKKGARVSTHINLPSKYIVLMPNTNIITISKKIENEEEKNRLITIVKDNLPQNTGAIIRTSAQGEDKENLIEDIKYISNKWNEIEKKNNEKSKIPCLIYKSPDIAEKIIIDTFSNGLEKIVVNNEKDFDKIKKETENNRNVEVIIKKDENILDKYDISKQIDKMKERKVWLKCGGFITIDKTEALTAIDVNTGKYTGKQNLEDTVYKVNEEATYEIAKQVRLRDIGGIIIVDYIDMNNIKNKEKIQRILNEKLKEDRAKTQVEGFTKLDLMEFTRKHICSHKS